MKTITCGFVNILFFLQLFGQSDQQLSSYLRNNPAADTNADGKLTRHEAKTHRQQVSQEQQPNEAAQTDPSTGDNLTSRSHIPGIDIPESISPIEVVYLESEDKVDLSFAYRKPEGEGPFPTILFFHGGGGHSNLQGLKNNLRTAPIHTRFLEKGFITIASTRRPYWKSKDERPTGFYDAVNDAAMIVEKAKTLPGVDPNKVVLYGGSGGAILAIATAAEVDLACVIAGEPATVVPLNPKDGQAATPRDYNLIMENPAGLYKGKRKSEMLSWMKKVDSPILVLQGKPIGLYKTNFEILIPEMKRLGKDISSLSFPGVTHGFYWGTVKTGATLETVEQIMEYVTVYIDQHST